MECESLTPCLPTSARLKAPNRSSAVFTYQGRKMVERDAYNGTYE